MSNTYGEKDLWTIRGLTGTDHFLLYDVSVNLSLKSKNYAVVRTSNKFAVGDSALIFYQKNLIVFGGKVVQCKQLGRDQSGITNYEVEIDEPGTELESRFIKRDSRWAVYILNKPSDKKKAGKFVEIILKDTGYKDVSNEDFRNADAPTNSQDEKMPGFGFSTSSVMSALKRVLVTTFNYGIWFDYGYEGQSNISSFARNIRYGEYNSRRTSFPTPYNAKVEENGLNYNVEGVIVFNEDKSKFATKGNVEPTNRIVAYKYSGIKSDEELQTVANKVYNDRVNIKARFMLDFAPGWYSVMPGDIFTLGIPSLGISNKEWGVKDVTITIGKTTVGFGADKVTVFDILSDRLSQVDGDSLYYNTKSLDTNYVDVLASYDEGTSTFDPDTWGPELEVPFTLEGKTFGNYFSISPILAPPGTMDENTPMLSTFIIGTSVEALTVSGEESFEFALSPAYFPWSFKWAELTVEYIFKTDNVEGSKAIWNASFGDLELFDDGLTQPQSSTRRTLTHHWLVEEQLEVPECTPKITVNFGGPGVTSVNLLDVTARLTIFYEVVDSVGDLTDENVLIGEIKMTGTPDEVPWTQFYDNQNAEAYEDFTMDLVDLYGIDHDNFELLEEDEKTPKERKFLVRIKGDTDATVRVIGEYLSFDENTYVEK